MPTARRRTKSSVAFESTWTSNSIGIPSFDLSGHDTLISSSTVTDISHGKNWNASFDGGDAMDLSSVEYTAYPDTFNYENGGKHAHGPFVPVGFVSGQNWGSIPAVVSDLSLLSLGATAISRTLPNSPAFDLANAIGELRADGIPSIVGWPKLREKAQYLKDSSSEYLNVEFGWKPLMSDLRKFAQAVTASKNLLHQYHKGSDQKIRRRYSFPEEQGSGALSTGVSGAGPMLLKPSFSIQPAGYGSRIGSTKTWFSGAFRYHLPVGNDLLHKFERYHADAAKLLGVDLTPSTVWELQPWSWAIDWFSNTGDLMKNISLLGKDGLVLQYGYICSSNRIETDYHTQPFQLGSRTYQAHLHMVEKTLKRRRATPYGFGFNMATLTARQEAILAALALSRGTR
jgi:hypothetical protein